MISVVIPTIDGREEHLVRCVESYERTLASYDDAGGRFELIVATGFPTCGIAWQWGADRAKGDYLHLTADDIEAKPGWWQAALQLVDPPSGHKPALPAPLVFHPDGEVQSCGGSWEQLEADGVVTEFTRVPFVSRNQWELIGPMIPTHYFTDNWVSYRGRLHGFETVVAHGYQFVHHHALESRNEGRATSDMLRFEAYKLHAGDLALA